MFKSKLEFHFNKLFNSGPEDDDFPETLDDMNALLVSANYQQIRDVASKMEPVLPEIFHRFNTSPFVDQFMNPFSMFLEALPANEIFIKYYDSILEGLFSNNDHVQGLWIKRVVKPVFINEGMLKSVARSSIHIIQSLRCVIRLLASESTMIASTAHDICVIASKSFRQEFFSPGILEELKKLKDQNPPNLEKDTLRLRVYEVIVDVSCNSQLQLDLMKSNGFLMEIINEFEVCW